MIVVDTNILAYFWLPGNFTKHTKALFDKDSKWIAPFFWRSEFRNILTLYLRKGLLTNYDANEITTNAEKMMKGNEYAVNSFNIIDKISECSLSAYDIEFVILAESLEVKLVTLDKMIIKEFPNLTESLILSK